MTAAASPLIALVFALLPWGSASAEETPSVEPKKPEPTPTPSVEPELAHTGIAAGGALLTAGALIGAGLLIRNRRDH